MTVDDGLRDCPQIVNAQGTRSPLRRYNGSVLGGNNIEIHRYSNEHERRKGKMGLRGDLRGGAVVAGGDGGEGVSP